MRFPRSFFENWADQGRLLLVLWARKQQEELWHGETQFARLPRRTQIAD